MDLRQYYQKIRDLEATIGEPFPVVVSEETQDGGKAGARTEVPRGIAARMVVNGRARLAKPEEAQQFRDQNAEAKRTADEMATAARVEVTVVPSAELKRLKEKSRSAKE